MLPSGHVNGDPPLLRLRHSITDTDYRIAVFAAAPDRLREHKAEQKWYTTNQCGRLPLTGLTRKILRRLDLASATHVIVSK